MERCERCGKPKAVCVCDRLQSQRTGHEVVVLQHPQEQDEWLGTAPLLVTGIGARRVVGLSWPNLAAALGAPASGRWAVIWPTQLPRELTAEELAQPVVRVGAGGDLQGVLVLDGSWSQAKTLWWRNAWLQRLERIVVHPREPSIYGRMRREPRREAISTLEATVDALVALGEPPEIGADLKRAMRTMVQRARDSSIEPT